MPDEEKNDPQLKLSELELGKPVKIKLEAGKSIASGESKYGGWSLWLAQVENVKVFDKSTKKAIEGHTGKVTLFPSRKLEEKLLEATGGVRINVEIEVTPTPKKNARGSLYTEYEVKVISEGEMPSDAISYTYHKYMGDFAIYTKNRIIEETEEMFVQFGQKTPYNLAEKTLKDFWKVYLDKYKKE